MKKFVGILLLICGFISLPKAIGNLGNASHGYELIGILIGQGLIFFLAYLCLRSKNEDEKK